MADTSHWQQGLEQLWQQGILSGYALVTRRGCCETAQGTLSKSESTSELVNIGQHFCNMLDSEKQVPALSILGQKLIVYKQTNCDIYAISRRKSLGLCLNNLPFGVLISVFEKPVIPQTAILKLEALCSKLRA